LYLAAVTRIITGGETPQDFLAIAHRSRQPVWRCAEAYVESLSMWLRARRVPTYRTRAPWLMLVGFTIPVFAVVLIVAIVLGAAPFWAAVAAAMVTIAAQVVVDAIWRHRHRPTRRRPLVD